MHLAPSDKRASARGYGGTGCQRCAPVDRRRRVVAGTMNTSGFGTQARDQASTISSCLPSPASLPNARVSAAIKGTKKKSCRASFLEERNSLSKLRGARGPSDDEPRHAAVHGIGPAICAGFEAVEVEKGITSGRPKSPRSSRWAGVAERTSSRPDELTHDARGSAPGTLGRGSGRGVLTCGCVGEARIANRSAEEDVSGALPGD